MNSSDTNPTFPDGVTTRRKGCSCSGALLAGFAALFAHPEEVADDEPCERSAVFTARDVAELLAERRETRVVGRLRQGHRDQLIGLGRSRRPGLRLRALAGLPGRLCLRGLPARARGLGLPGARSELTGTWRLGLCRQRW